MFNKTITLPLAIPPEVQQLFEKFGKDLGRIKLAAPTEPELRAIVAAGPGEHQDRLFTMATKMALARWFDAWFNAHDAEFTAITQKYAPPELKAELGLPEVPDSDDKTPFKN